MTFPNPVLPMAQGTQASLPSYVGGRSKGYDPLTCLYNGNAATLRTFRSKVSGTKQGGMCRVCCIGDSVIGGTGSNTPTSWPMLLRGQLALANGAFVRGSGVCYAGNGIADARWSFTGANVNSGLFLTMPNAATAQFVSTETGQNVDIYLFSNTGTVSYQIDGGALTPIVPAGGTTVQKVTINGLANATHTVKLTATAANVFLIGVNVYSNTAGLQFTNAGEPNTQTSDWTSTAFVTKFQQATVETNEAFIISLGALDAGAAVALATYQANLLTIVNNCLALGAVMLVTESQPQTVPLATWQGYVNAQWNVADIANIPLLDMTDRWKDWNTANTLGMMLDATHPNVFGYSDISTAMLGVLQP